MFHHLRMKQLLEERGMHSFFLHWLQPNEDCQCTADSNVEGRSIEHPAMLYVGEEIVNCLDHEKNSFLTEHRKNFTVQMRYSQPMDCHTVFNQPL